jgi:integrase
MPKFYEGFADEVVVPSGKRDVQVFDDELPGFGVRKFSSGQVAYFVKYNVGPQQRRHTLGAVVRGNLRDMRLSASKILAKARLGIDAVAEKRAAAEKQIVSLNDVVKRYLPDRKPNLRPRYYAEIKRQLENDWKPLHKEPIDGLTRQSIIGVIDDIAAERGEVAADRARTALGGLFSWAIERGYCEVNPTLNIGARAQGGARDRVLTEPELVEVWCASEEDDYGRIVKLLILTGQRKTEIGHLIWPEVYKDKRQIDLPAGRTKNHRAHLVPLSDEALAILESIKQRKGRDFIFGRGAGGFSGWSKAKRELDTRIAAGRAKAGIKKAMPGWRIHDLRRSFITHINERGFAQPHVVEAIVNHISGHLAGVAGTYNRAQYLAERRRALEVWGLHITNLLEASASKIVPFRKRQQEA